VAAFEALDAGEVGDRAGCAVDGVDELGPAGVDAALGALAALIRMTRRPCASRSSAMARHGASSTPTMAMPSFGLQREEPALGLDIGLEAAVAVEMVGGDVEEDGHPGAIRVARSSW
jgi:hypothetical protein